MLAEAAAGRLETLATELEQLLASEQPLEEVVARWRGLRRDADVLREHASANLVAAERLERAVATLEEKEQQYQQVRAKQEQDHLRRLQQVVRQAEALLATEPVTLKAGDRALREIKAAAHRGYGLAVNEAEPGVTAIAAAIRSRVSGTAVGTVSIAGPSVRITEKRIRELAPRVVQCAAELSALWPLRLRHVADVEGEGKDVGRAAAVTA